MIAKHIIAGVLIWRIMAKKGLSNYDTADYLNTTEDIVAYLNAAMEDSDPDSLLIALSDIGRSKVENTHG